MNVKNSYPELPEIPYKRTTVSMTDVVIYAKSLVGKYSKDTVRMAYCIIRNESANGQKGINNNYAGIQADVGRWTNLPGNPVATCIKWDGDKLRRFLCFDSDGYKVSFELLCIKIQQRNMVTIDDYFKKWVGNPKSDTPQARQNIQSLLRSSLTAIP